MCYNTTYKMKGVTTSLGSLIVIFNWIGLVCSLWWICNFIYLLFLNGLSNTSFSIFNVIFIIISVIIAALFGLNGHARGRLTPLVDGVLSFVFYCCVFYAIYSFGILKGLALYYVLIEIVGYIQRK